MKKYVLSASAVILAIAFTAFICESKRFSSIAFEFVGSAFEMGDAPGKLGEDENWVSSSPSCEGENKSFLCKVIVTFQHIAPPKQQILVAIKAEYERLISFSHTFKHGYSFHVVLNGETVTVTIYCQQIA